MSVVEPNMAVHQNKHQSDLEKRLKILRQQFYGKTSVPSTQYQVPKEEIEKNISSLTMNSSSDVAYLNQDLTKISILAGTALGIQIILYSLLKNNILNINLF